MLSCVAALWSTKSVTCVATALLLSAFFQLLHALYYPFKSRGVNRLQQLCLSTLSLIYFIGVLTKAQALEDEDSEQLGVMMVVLLVCVAALFVGTALFGVWHVVHSMRKAQSAIHRMRNLPLSDPKDDSDAFYLIQFPVVDPSPGQFKPRLPHELAHVSEQQKLAMVRKLTAENEGRLEAFFAAIRTRPVWETGMTLVEQPSEIDSDEKVRV